MPTKPLILVADGDKEVRHRLCEFLQLSGFDTLEAGSGLEAYDLTRHRYPAAIVLEVELRDKDGFDICRMIRKEEATRNMPVIMLTSRSQTRDRFAGFRAGADDYVTKPFSSKELILRLQALLRRSGQTANQASLKVGPFEIDFSAMMLTVGGRPNALSKVEFKLLHLLVSKMGTVVEREVIFRDVWGRSAAGPQSRTLDTHVKRLRDKMEPYSAWLKTARHQGYQFGEPDPE